MRLVRKIIVAPPPPSGGLEGTYAAGNPIPGGLLDEFQTQSGNTISNVNATYSVSNATQYLTSVGDNGSFTFDSNAATVGSHTVDVTVYDYDGLGSDATATVTFSVS